MKREQPRHAAGPEAPGAGRAERGPTDEERAQPRPGERAWEERRNVGVRPEHVSGADGQNRGDGPVRGDGQDRADRQERAEEQERAPASQLPRSPARLDWPTWRAVFRRVARESKIDGISDWAAALTYRAILSLFPGLLVVLSIVGLLGRSTSDKLLNNLEKHAPDSVVPTLNTIFETAQDNHEVAGVIGIASLIVAVWSASGYVAAFMRASNSIYDISEGRPVWKTAPVRLGITLFLVVAVVISVAIAVLAGGIATDVGNLVGLGQTAVDVWGFIKWPVIVIIAALTLALLYWAAPNAKQGGFTWMTPGGFLTVVVWVAATAGFIVYVANFSNYKNTYGSLAGIVIFLIWLWISNIVLLLGAELNAELQRARAMHAGVPEDEEPYVRPRDSRKLSDAERDAAEKLSRQLRAS